MATGYTHQFIIRNTPKRVEAGGFNIGFSAPNVLSSAGSYLTLMVRDLRTDVKVTIGNEVGVIHGYTPMGQWSMQTIWLDKETLFSKNNNLAVDGNDHGDFLLKAVACHFLQNV